MILDIKNNRKKTIKNSHWMIYDHYLSIKQWSLDFFVNNDEIDQTTL